MRNHMRRLSRKKGNKLDMRKRWERSNTREVKGAAESGTVRQRMANLELRGNDDGGGTALSWKGRIADRFDTKLSWRRGCDRMAIGIFLYCGGQRIYVYQRLFFMYVFF